jgi:hypothetical protein
MCCDDLVCARCAQPVAQGGCPVCRHARAELHPSVLSGPALVALAVALLLVAAVLTGFPALLR